MSTTTVHHGSLPSGAAISSSSPGVAFIARLLPSLDSIDPVFQQVNLPSMVLPDAMCCLYGKEPTSLLISFLKIGEVRSGFLDSSIREPSTIWDIELNAGTRTVIMESVRIYKLKHDPRNEHIRVCKILPVKL